MGQQAEELIKIARDIMGSNEKLHLELNGRGKVNETEAFRLAERLKKNDGLFENDKDRDESLTTIKRIHGTTKMNHDYINFYAFDMGMKPVDMNPPQNTELIYLVTNENATIETWGRYEIKNSDESETSLIEQGKRAYAKGFVLFFDGEGLSAMDEIEYQYVQTESEPQRDTDFRDYDEVYYVYKFYTPKSYRRIWKR